MAEEPWKPMDHTAEAMSRLLHPSGISRDPQLVAATEAVAHALLAISSKLHVIAYRRTFQEAAARSGLSMQEVAEDPEAATLAMTAARLSREELLRAALDSLSEVRKLVEYSESQGERAVTNASLLIALDGE